MAQTTLPQLLPVVDVDTALGDIAAAENVYEVSALTAKILAGVATNSATSARHLNALSGHTQALATSADTTAAHLQQSVNHLQAMARRGDAEHPVHVTFGTQPLVINFNIHEESVTVIRMLLVEHLGGLQKRIDDANEKYRASETKHQELHKQHQDLKAKHEALSRKYDSHSHGTGTRPRSTASDDK